MKILFIAFVVSVRNTNGTGRRRNWNRIFFISVTEVLRHFYGVNMTKKPCFFSKTIPLWTPIAPLPFELESQNFVWWVLYSKSTTYVHGFDQNPRYVFFLSTLVQFSCWRARQKYTFFETSKGLFKDEAMNILSSSYFIARQLNKNATCSAMSVFLGYFLYKWKLFDGCCALNEIILI